MSENTPSEDLIKDALTLLTKLKDVGRIRRGTNEVTKCIERGMARLVYVADDVSPPEVVRHLPILAREKNVAYLNIPSSERLGNAAGLDVGAASIAIQDAGSADADLKSIVDRVKQFN